MKTITYLLNRSKTLLQIASFGAMAVSSLLMPQSAIAGKFGVKVVDDQGQVVTGASVCFGLPGNFKQFGVMFTDAEGKAFVDVPNVPFVVTVSKTRFSGLRLSEPARNFTLIKQVTLMDGVPGPRCRAGSTLASNSSIIIKNVDVTERRNATVLVPSVVSGKPNHYRISKSLDFDDANWMPYSDEIVLSRKYTHEEAVFLQLRRFQGSSVSWLEARSDVITVHLNTDTINPL